ncbi:MAG: nicotinate-nucleotide--dimethylbenzimidazole phosphoribosyltransferase [Dehalococcoidia bacterium]|nr:MAG: nicotinate-nucleotide--dimethylbenzimidazole phosphoribosyltransferase [Dehalococcoidia bacterium]
MTERLQKTIEAIKPLDRAAMRAAGERQDNLTKPRGSLGRLEALAVQIAGIRREPVPVLENKAIITMAADHGVTRQAVSLYPPEVTRQMVLNFIGGGAAINVLARHIGGRVIVVDMGVAGGLVEMTGLVSRPVAPGTQDFSLGAAMSRQQAVTAIETGIEILEGEVKRGLDIVGTGDMGIGNTTSASAICAAVTGRPVSEVTGRGTGIDDRQLAHKVGVIEKALNTNRPDPADPLDVLAKVGGFEIGGLAGVMLGGAARQMPVVIDGFISGAAALIACGLAPRLKDYLIPSHLSVEAGHRAVYQHLGLKPCLDLDMRLGEGTGAALGIFLAEAATRLLGEMATFKEASVSQAEPGKKRET